MEETLGGVAGSSATTIDATIGSAGVRSREARVSVRADCPAHTTPSFVANRCCRNASPGSSKAMSNMVLNKLDWFLHAQGRHGNEQGSAWKAGRPNVRFVRYADDWCVFITRSSQQHAERLRDRIRALLTQHCGVELSLEKTRITHVRDGFDFLGFHLELGVGRNGTYVPKVRVPRKAALRQMKCAAYSIRCDCDSS